MFKPSIAFLFFLASSLSYSEKLKIDVPINNPTHDEITPLEWFGFGIYAGSWYALKKNKDLIDNSYAHIRLEKPAFDYLKRLKVMRGCSLFGIGIGALIIFSQDISKYLK